MSLTCCRCLPALHDLLSHSPQLRTGSTTGLEGGLDRPNLRRQFCDLALLDQSGSLLGFDLVWVVVN